MYDAGAAGVRGCSRVQMAADEKARMQKELREAGLTRLPAKSR